VCLISVRERDKPGAVRLARSLIDRGFEIVATHGTADAPRAGGVRCRRANKVREGRPHIVDMIKNDEINLIVNTTEGKRAIHESNSIPPRGRRAQGDVLHDARRGARDLRGHRPPAGSRGEPASGSSQGGSGMSRKPLTLKGAEKLRIELRRLKSEERPRVIQAIAEARPMAT